MKRIFFIISFILIAATSFAASVSFVAKSSHKTVEAGQRFQITYTINANGGNFTPPPFKGFDSRNAGQSSSTQNINGKVTRTNSISYILASRTPGKYKIAPAQLEINGEVFKSNAIEVEVVAVNQNSANSQKNRQNTRSKNAKELEDYIFVRAVVDKKSAYVGEKIAVSFKLYYQLGISQLNPDKFPGYSGFWSKDITDKTNSELPIERFNGEEYNVALIQQLVLIPQKSGELVIDPMELNTVVQVRTRKARTFMEQMMGGGVEQKEVRIKSAPITLNIKALPNKGRPENFSGAVGQFKMTFGPNKTQVKSNEAIDFAVKISGSGNLPLIGAPALTFPSDFEIYDPKTKNNFKTTTAGSKGNKEFTYLVIPRHSGTFEIEPYTFNYFDPIAKQYKSIGHEPITIQVERGEEEENVVFTPRDKEAVELLNTDIRYLHINNVTLAASGDLFYGSVPFYVFFLGAFILFVILFVLSRKRKEMNTDVAGIKKSKANKMAKKRMAKAKQHLDANETNSFYEEISAALFGYYSDKFNISMADLSQEKITDLIADASIQAELKIVLDEAEMARFAPSASISAADLYNKSIEIISKTEDLKS